MEKRYETARKMTDSVVDLYMNLANLHKEGKEDTNEYNDLLSLLPIAIQAEEKKYCAFNPLKSQINENVKAIIETPKDDMYFITISKETISAIRCLNMLDKSKIYALDGIVLKHESILKVHTYLDENFLYELCMYLDSRASESERDTLIDFKYALLASLPHLDIENTKYPKVSDNMCLEEIKASETYIFPKVNTLVNHLFEITDENITPYTIIYILYVKASIRLLPPLYKSVVTEELRNSINLQEFLGILKNDKYNKICNMLKYLLEESTKGKNRKEKINI